MHLVGPESCRRQALFALFAGVLWFAAVSTTCAAEAPPPAAPAAAPAPAPPRSITAGGARLPVLQVCDAEQYDCSLTVAPGGPVTIFWAWQDARNYYRVDLGPAGASLTRVLKGRADVLARSAGPALSKDGETPVLLRRREHALYVVVHNRILLDALDSSFTTGVIAGRRVTVAGFQPAEEISFSDDFMRTEKEQQLGQWTQVRGAWQFHSVKETNPNADVRLSVNPFSLGLHDPKGGLLTVGFPFWNDYTVSASVKSAGTEAGVAFAYHGPEDYYLLRIDLNGIRPGPAEVALVKVTPHGEKVLGSGKVRAASGEWYRLGVRTLGPRIQAMLDGDILFDVFDRDCAGGPAGLYSKGTVDTFFDDVKVESTDVYAFDRPEVLARNGHAAGGTWKTLPAPRREAEYAGTALLAEEGKPLARYLLGDPCWQGGVLKARVRVQGNDGSVGILYGYRDDANWCLARWTVASGQQEREGAAAPMALQLFRCVGGKKQVVAQAPAPLEPGVWHDLEVDCTPAGFTHISLDGRMRLRAPVPDGDARKGHVGLYTYGVERAVFASLDLRERRDVQRELQVANQVFQNDPFMLHWASAKGQWFPTTIDAAALQKIGLIPAGAAPAALPLAYWNKGDFFNAYTISLPVYPGLYLAFGADTQDWAQGYSISMDAAEKNVRIHLNRLGKEVKVATINRQSAATQVVLHHDGDVTWLTLDDKDLFTYHDREALPGRKVGLITPTPAQVAAANALLPPPAAGAAAPPAEFDLAAIQVERENVADYPFDEANCDWEQYGDWVVTNRFSCTPTWSHLTAIGDRACILWNKYAFEGDVTLEFYAGMRMGHNPAMWYARIGDLNATICGENDDLSTGYSYLVGAWDPGWTEKWTKLLRKDQCVQQTEKYTVPRDRETSGVREIEVPWIAEGRPVHGAWYYIKICKVGHRLDCYFDNEKIFTYEDPKPLDGRFIALWTQMNEIVVARCRISYEKRYAPRRLLSTAPGAALETLEALSHAPLRDTRPAPAAGKPAAAPEKTGARPAPQPAKTGKAPAIPAKTGKAPAVRAGGRSAELPRPPAAPIRRVSLLANRGRTLTPQRRLALCARLAARAGRPIRLPAAAPLASRGEAPRARQSGARPAARPAPAASRKPAAPPAPAGNGHAAPDIAIPLLTSTTHPGLVEDFERAGSAWAPSGTARDVAVVRVPGGPEGSRYCLRITNYSPGADLGLRVPVPAGMDARRAFVQFDYCLSPEAKINLYVTINGRMHFVKMTGGGEDHPLLPLLGSMDVQADGHWHRAFFDLGAAYSERLAANTLPPLPPAQPMPAPPGAVPPFPTNKPVIQDMRFGYFHEGYLRAGIGGNGPGAWWGLDNFLLATSSHAVPVVAWSMPATRQEIAKSVAERATNAALLAAAAPAAKADRQPPLVYTFACDRNPDTDPGPENKVPAGEVNRTLTGLADGLWFAHVRCRRADGTWTQTAHLPFRIFSRPPSLRLANAPADGRWGGEPLLFEVQPAGAPAPDMARLFVTVNGQAVEQPQRLADYDPARRQLTLDLQRSGLVFADAQPVKLGVQLAAAEGVASDNEFTLTMDRAHDSRPPDAPVVKTAGYFSGFEEDLGTWEAGAALCVRDTTSAASGKASLRIVNQTLASAFSATAVGKPFSAGKYPLLQFAYRVPDTVCVNWALATKHGTYGINFTDPNDSCPILATIPDVKRDDLWHTAQVSLHDALAASPFYPDQYDVSALSIGDRGYTGGAPGASYWIDDFRLVPTESSAAGLTVSWTAQDCSGIKAYRYKWSAKPDDTPDTVLPGTTTEYTFKGIPEGLVYLHLQAQDGAGNWSPAAHVPYLIDNTPPVLAPAPAAPVKVGSSTWKLPVTDVGPSGVDPATLQVSINGKVYPLGDYFTTRDAATGALSWEWPLATGLFSDPVADGTPFEFAIGPVKDFAGNTAPGATYKYVVDRASDKEPPRAPAVTVAGQPMVSLDTFTRDLGQWQPYSSGAMPMRVLDTDRQDYCLEGATSGATYGYYIRSTPFDAMQTPWVSFEYKCPAGCSLYFMIHAGGTWNVVPLSGTYSSYRNLAKVPGFVADGKWHAISLNLVDLLKPVLGDVKQMPITYFTLWHYGSPGGLTYRIDNFHIFGASKPDPQVTWQAADATGIEGFRYRVDDVPEAGPDGGTDTPARQVTLSGLKPGVHFLRVRAKDGAGNLSTGTLVGVDIGG